MSSELEQARAELALASCALGKAAWSDDEQAFDAAIRRQRAARRVVNELEQEANR